LTDSHTQAAPELRFDGEFDRVYEATARPLLLKDGANRLHIEQSPTWLNNVVWNPGAALSARMVDMPDNGYQHMLCVEAAQVDTPVKVSPQATWQGWQRFTVLQDSRPQERT